MSPDDPPSHPPGTDPEPPVRAEPRVGGRVGGVLTQVAAVAAVSLWGLTVAGRVWHAPPGLFVALVTFLPYLYAALVAAVFLLWSLAPDRRGPPLLLGGLVLTALVLWGPAWPSRAEQADGEPITVMSWNVRRLWGGPADGGDPAACVIAAIRDADPDVLTLLEVSRDDVDTLSSALDLRCAHVTYRGTDNPRQGGLASCVRGDRWSLREGGGQRFVDREDWYYVASEVERSGRVVNLLSIHLYPYAFSEERLREGLSDLFQGAPEDIVDLNRTGERVNRAQGGQSRALLGRVARFRDPTVVAGDFNSTRDAALHADLRRHMTDTWERGGHGFGGTVHLRTLPLRVDYVYATGAFAVAGARVPVVGCSDHRPVVSRLVLREQVGAPGYGDARSSGEE